MSKEKAYELCVIQCWGKGHDMKKDENGTLINCCENCTLRWVRTQSSN